MKIIFLDVDGVLNSWQYYKENEDLICDEPIDPENVACLSEIVKATGAKLVLSSSWRGGWDKNPAKMEAEGKYIEEALAVHGMKIYDKTGSSDVSFQDARCREIKAWLRKHPLQVESFVILDDGDFLWEAHKLTSHLVLTDFEDRGLCKKHIEPAIKILNHTKRKLFAYL